MKETYRAMQVTTPGVLELVERAVRRPGPGEVLIAVEACGICGAGATDIGNADPTLQPPRVPCHEVVGRIVTFGPGVASIWSIGQRVGIGRKGGPCLECRECRAGRLHLCPNQSIVGASCDGGYAEMMIARATGLVAIPGELSAEEAAPILCAGIATFNALKKCGAEAGDTVAIVGIGGLGHMALQYARKMGFRVVAVGRGADIAQVARDLGAHVYLDTKEGDAAAKLKALGGVQALVSTISDPEAMGALIAALLPQGRLVVLSAGREPLSIPTGPLVSSETTVMGSITGSPLENEKTLAFSLLAEVRPRIEVLPLERAREAYDRMRSGEVQFRMVLTMRDRQPAAER